MPQQINYWVEHPQGDGLELGNRSREFGLAASNDGRRKALIRVMSSAPSELTDSGGQTVLN